MSFSQLPASILIEPDPFTLQVPEEEISNLKTILRLSRLGQDTWWNQQDDAGLGVSSKWLSQAKDTWLTKFNWRQQEDAINAFPNFYSTVEDPEHGSVRVHFTALFSQRPDATPINFMHGWPGSFLEFLPILRRLRAKYTPETLPYHVIVPSLPGYGLSSKVPIAKEFKLECAARIINQLMVDLGFGKGYVAQGGDVGSMLSAVLLRDYKECKAAHFNILSVGLQRMDENTEGLLPFERERIKAVNHWLQTGMAYAMEHGTRPSTIGHALSASPLSILAWIGEKFVEWADIPIPIDDILAHATLYWFTSTISSSLYPYRCLLTSRNAFETDKKKPIGYSWFMGELSFLPKSMVNSNYPNMIQYKSHAQGGHFAALEQPEVLLQDVEEFVAGLGEITSDQH